MKIKAPIFIFHLLFADGLMRCYSCTSTSESSPCETDPSTLPHGILDVCSRDACTIVRVEEWPSQRVKYVIDIIVQVTRTLSLLYQQ